MEQIDKKISVVIPCYNEAENIPELYRRLHAVLLRITTSYEIIFTDNCSTDNSPDILRNLAERDKLVSVIFFSRNFGSSQQGYSAGTAYASGDAVVWMEGDLQDPPEIIEKFVEKWLEGYDVVYGVRPKAVGSFFLRNGRRAFYWLFAKLSYLTIPRNAGDFSLLDREAADWLNAMPERLQFVRGMRAWIGFKQTGIEYERGERKRGRTSNPNFWRNVWWAKKFIFSFSYAPLEFISRAAWWLILISFAITIALIVAATRGFVSWSVTIFSIGGLWLSTLIMSSLAILGEILSIIFEEVKQRPKYIIREILNDHRV